MNIATAPFENIARILFSIAGERVRRQPAKLSFFPKLPGNPTDPTEPEPDEPKALPVKRSYDDRSRFTRLAMMMDQYVAPRLAIKEQTFFAKRLSFLTRAGVPMLESLHILRTQSRTRSHRRILDQIIEDTSQGQALSKSFGKFPHVFGDFAINIIKVGESSGVLSENLDYLADELKKKQILRRKVIGALVYPALITTATVGITIFLMVYLFPKIMPIFSSLHMTLPMSTKIVIAISNFLQKSGFALFAGIFLFVTAFSILIKKNKASRMYFHGFLLQIPLVGKMVQYYNLANATRTLGIMLKGGVTLSEALPLTADTSQNLVYKRHFRALAHTINRGERMSTYLAAHRNVFPDILAQLVAVGEKTGNLSNTLLYLSDLYENEVDDFAKDISTLIEPLLMIFMGLLVGFIAVSIITPIYGITQSLHG